jgi:hypothetical protein
MNIAIGIAIYFLIGFIAMILSIRFDLITETNDKYIADALLTMFLWPILTILAIVYLIINLAEKIANIGKKK